MSEQAQPLYWDASYALALALMEAHPEASIEDVGLNQLYQWVVALPSFADEPALVNEAILMDIMREWYEEVSAR
jgi:FeS assembly protein IscX